MWTPVPHPQLTVWEISPSVRCQGSHTAHILLFYIARSYVLINGAVSMISDIYKHRNQFMRLYTWLANLSLSNINLKNILLICTIWATFLEGPLHSIAWCVMQIDVSVRPSDTTLLLLFCNYAKIECCERPATCIKCAMDIHKILFMLYQRKSTVHGNSERLICV